MPVIHTRITDRFANLFSERPDCAPVLSRNEITIGCNTYTPARLVRWDAHRPKRLGIHEDSVRQRNEQLRERVI